LLALRHRRQSARLLAVDSDEKLELLRRFAPTLHFDALERWRPGLVDRYLEHSTVLDGKERWLPGTPPAEPKLRENVGDLKAQLNPLQNGPGLDTQLRSNEMLSAYGGDEDRGGGGAAYGRIVDADNALFLQYWLFYPDNPCVLPPGRHDGDWELVQLRVEHGGDGPEATQVTLAEHGKPVTRQVAPERRLEGPDVFVAVDSHACYFLEGAHPTIPLSDVCDPDGAPGMKPSVKLLPIAADKRDWAHWSGRWGMDRGPGTRLALRLGWKRTPWPLTRLNKVGAGESPPSPGHQGASWRFPQTFALNGTRRKWTTVAVQRLAHLIGQLTWPKLAPRVTVTPSGPGGKYTIDAKAAGRFLRRVTLVSVAFWEESPDGRRRALAMHSAPPGRHEVSLELSPGGKLVWRAAGYNFLRQRGDPVDEAGAAQ
jgi:hypothetical protein